MLGLLLKIAALIVALQFGVRFMDWLFQRPQRVFYVSSMRQFKMVFWSLLSFWLGGSMMSLLLRDQSTTPLEKAIALGVGSLLFLFALPTLLVHFQYWRYERENALELDKATKTALLLQPGEKYVLTPQQIHHIEETRCKSKQVFWSSYRYFTIWLQDGRQVKITSLLMDLETLQKLWPQVPHYTKTKWACFL